MKFTDAVEQYTTYLLLLTIEQGGGDASRHLV